MSRSDFELPFASIGVTIALIKGLAPGCSDFEHEAGQIFIEEVDPPSAWWTNTLPNKARR